PTRIWTVALAASRHRLGLVGDIPRLPQARRSERRTYPSRTPEGLGGQPASAAGEGAAHARSDPKELQQLALQRQEDEEGFACRPDRPRRVCGGREGGEGRRTRRKSPLYAWAHGRVARADRCGVLHLSRTGRGRVPEFLQGQ